MQLPSGWEAIELDDDARWCATLRRRGVRFEVDAHRTDGEWTATVTQVRRGQRHRLALLQRPSLGAIVQAAEALLARP